MKSDGMVEAILEVQGVQWATQAMTVESILGRRKGVVAVHANPVAQTATVRFDPTLTSPADLQQWIRECGYHCAGLSVPNHLCDPLVEPGAPADRAAVSEPAEPAARHDNLVIAHNMSDHHMSDQHMSDQDIAYGAVRHGPTEHVDKSVGETPVMSPHDAMGHGGHAGMSMDSMVADM